MNQLENVIFIKQDFNIPEWLTALAHTVNFKLSETSSIPVDGLYFDGALSLYLAEFSDIPWSIDFYQHFKGLKNPKSNPLVKALGLNKEKGSYCDFTFGTGKDSIGMLSLGHKVFAYERNPWVYCLNVFALKKDLEQLDFLKNLTLNFGSPNLNSLLPSNIIYIDPMFPHKKKSAKPKKSMQIFQKIVGVDEDEAELFKTAMSFKDARVVVKRPAFAPNIGVGPSAIYEGKTIRFEMYISKN